MLLISPPEDTGSDTDDSSLQILIVASKNTNKMVHHLFVDPICHIGDIAFPFGPYSSSSWGHSWSSKLALTPSVPLNGNFGQWRLHDGSDVFLSSCFVGIQIIFISSIGIPWLLNISTRIEDSVFILFHFQNLFTKDFICFYFFIQLHN